VIRRERMLHGLNSEMSVDKTRNGPMKPLECDDISPRCWLLSPGELHGMRSMAGSRCAPWWCIGAQSNTRRLSAANS
jgi:hypothetical protein